MSDEPIYVTQPDLPPLEDLLPLLSQIWDRKVVTNNGPFHQELESKLSDYLEVPYVSLFANGTLALVAALKALKITGDVITTPYSFVATAHSLAWNGIRPIFVDVEPNTFNLDPSKIEAAITPNTTAILPVHCYGNPCDVDAIQQIADAYNLKVIYDAAHAFAVKCHCGSVLNHGDLSTLSFHATKVFNTLEGGAIVSQTRKMKKHIDDLKNFGFAGETRVVATGINAKMNEVQAAIGLLQLKKVDAALEARKAIAKFYGEEISLIDGIKLISNSNQLYVNHSYFPIIVNDSFPLTRDQLYEKLRSVGIYGRRYFYPLISQFSMYRGLDSAIPTNLPVASDVANRVICLPIYPALSREDQYRVVQVLHETGRQA